MGKIVEAVESSPEAQRTVIVYCSDHGDMACEHGMWWKSSFYEGSSRVPLIISWPGRFPQGAQDPTLLSLIDVGPTVLELAGADPLPDVAGMSFAGRLSQDTADADSSHEVYSEYLGLLGDRPSFMIRTGPWKLNTYSEFGSCQLFHLEEDPGEVHDRTGDPGCASVVRECLAKVNGRYSAARMLEAVEAQQRAADLTRRCGHAPIPHPVPPFEPPEGSNVFDFGQLGRAG